MPAKAIISDHRVVPRHLAKGKPGPKTAAAKAAVVANAVTHGMTSSLPFIPGVESQEEAEAFAANFINALDLEGAAEMAIARRAAGLLWRMQRIERFEVQAISASIDAVEEDYRKANAWGQKPGTLDGAEEDVETATRRLALVRDLPNLPVGTFIDGDEADVVITYLGGDDINLKEKIEGFGDSYATGTLLMIIARTVAEHCDAPIEQILSDAVENAQSALAEAEKARADTLTGLDRMRRQREAPPEHLLHAVARYEANLDRAFHRCMTQLDVMRAARQGNPIPLARLQVET